MMECILAGRRRFWLLLGLIAMIAFRRARECGSEE
jgi:hypothetical protein